MRVPPAVAFNWNASRHTLLSSSHRHTASQVRWVWIVVLVVLISANALAQTGVDLSRSTGTPTTIYQGTDIEHVDTVSGNLKITIPLLHLPGRGMDTSITLNYNSKMFETEISAPPGATALQLVVALDSNVSALGYQDLTAPAGLPGEGHQHPLSPGWSLGVPEMGQIFGDGLNNCTVPPCTATFARNDGTSDLLFGQTTTSMFSGDGSFQLYQLPNVHFKNGAVLTLPPNNNTQDLNTQVLTDPNGNTITCRTNAAYVLADCFDTLGRAIVFPPDSLTGLPAGMQYLDSAGVTRNVFFSYTFFTLNYPFRDSTQTGCNDVKLTPLNVPMLTSITLPNHTSYTFKYVLNPDGSTTGEIERILLPTGGYVRYSYGWAQFDDTSDCGGLHETMAQNRMVMSRAISSDGTAATEQLFGYSQSNIPNSQNARQPFSKMTVTQPDGNSMVLVREHNVTLPFETNFEDASGAVVKQILGNVEFNTTSNYCSDAGCPRYSAVRTVWAATNQVSLKSFSYSPYNDVITEDDSDWGVADPGPLLRETQTAYLDQLDSRYADAHIFGLPSSTIVCSPMTATEAAAGPGDCPQNNALKRRSETDKTYDEANLLTPYSGPLALPGRSTAPNALRGNLTTISRWLDTNNTFVTTHTNWYDTGVIFKTVDALGNPTTHTYDSDSGAFRTETCDALNHCVHGTYDLNTGVQTSFTDGNGQKISYSYDLMSRIKQATFPGQLVNGVAYVGQTTFSYDDTPGAMSLQRTQQQDGATSVTDMQFFDGLGRRTGSQLNDPVGNVFTTATFDGLNRVTSVSNPFRTATDATYGLTTTKYDALGRAIETDYPDGTTVLTSYRGNATETQDEGNGTSRVTRIYHTDGLGRLTAVCEVTSSTSITGDVPSDCGLEIAGTGFVTLYEYDALGNVISIQQGSIGRAFSYDSLSRLVSATNPESGTTTYTYDANGNERTRSRPAPNQGDPSVRVTTTYDYDNLNRLTAITYSDGITPSVTMHYDNTIESGIALNNTVGRLSAEYVNSPGGQLLYGRVFSYDAVGRVLDNSQCLPQSCGTQSLYNLTYSYDLLGKPVSATNGKGVTITYAYNSAGRMSSVTSSLSDSNHPGSMLSDSSFNPFGAIISATLGGRVNEAVAYDCRGRVVVYQSSLVPNVPPPANAPIPGCPASVAGVINVKPSELNDYSINVFELGNDNLQSSLFDPEARQTILVSALPKWQDQTLWPHSGSSLTRADQRDRAEPGLMTFNTSNWGPVEPSMVTLRYGAGEKLTAIANRIAQQTNERFRASIDATATQTGGNVSFNLEGERRNRMAFLVAVPRVINNHARLLTATTIRRDRQFISDREGATKGAEQ
jgi:YD repeat-containing protein